MLRSNMEVIYRRHFLPSQLGRSLCTWVVQNTFACGQIRRLVRVKTRSLLWRDIAALEYGALRYCAFFVIV